MLRLRHLPLLLLACTAARAADGTPALLTISRAGLPALAYTAAEFAALPHVELTLVNPHDQKEHRYAGVNVRELLTRAGLPFGEKLRGPALQFGVVARAKDGYGVLFALAEFDEAFSSRTLLLADRIDGQPVPDSAAPLQLVVPGDKKAARWARMVASLEIISTATPPAKP
ncbi:MAG TPA: molybdopterin-dependent oxidoreductase [Opitutaceae bacterium]|nr:molybdopterin-dependent oxidoreductase [Opitutaceae bacterium]